MKKVEQTRKTEYNFQHFFSTMSITLILLLILAFIGSTIYIGYSSFMSGR